MRGVAALFAWVWGKGREGGYCNFLGARGGSRLRKGLNPFPEGSGRREGEVAMSPSWGERGWAGRFRRKGV